MASWLAQPPWKERSSEERPDGLPQCQHTLLVAVNSRGLGKAMLVGAAAAGRTLPSTPPCLGLGRGHSRGGTGGTFPMAPCPVVPWGLEVPVVQEGMSAVVPNPVPGCAQGLVALQVSHLWSQYPGLACTRAGHLG